MSGIINTIKKHLANHKRIVVYLIAVFLGILGVTGIICQKYILLMLSAGVFLCMCANCIVWKKNREPIKYFYPGSKVRNVNWVLIGDMCLVNNVIPQDKFCIQILAPGRSLASSFEILRHIFSILDEKDANVVIAVNKNNIQGGFTLFDIPIFELSPISVKRLGMEAAQIKAVLPLLFAPIASVKLLFDKRQFYNTELEIYPPEIVSFCKERNIHIQILAR